MKQGNGIYLLAFLCGVVIVNLLGDTTWANNSSLNRYSLALLSFQGIVYEEYLVEVLFLRFRTAVGLWVCSKLISKKVVATGFALIMCVALGSVIAMAILANGLWGILFCLCTLMPHIVCYGAAYILWSNTKGTYYVENKTSSYYLTTIFIILLIGIGCILEAYISPILIQNLIKY